MRIAICDDEIKWINIISNYFDEKDYRNIIIDEFQSSEQLLDIYHKKQKPYDLIITDICMPNIDGIKMANIIRDIDKSVLIIFLTNYNEYIRDCFSCMPMAFWDKPLHKEIIGLDMDRALDIVNNREKCFSFKFMRQNVRIPYDEILYVNNDNRKIKVHTLDREYEFNGRLKDYVDIFERHNFAMSHKSFCINLSYIKCKKSYEIILFNDEVIPISNACKKSFEEKYIDFIKTESGL